MGEAVTDPLTTDERLHPLFGAILEGHGMKPRRPQTTRVCAICGKPSSPRMGSTEGFITFLRLNGIPGEKAHPRCVRAYGAEHPK